MFKHILVPVDGSDTSLAAIDKAAGLTGKVLMIGFGRFGQVASQFLSCRRCW